MRMKWKKFWCESLKVKDKTVSLDTSSKPNMLGGASQKDHIAYSKEIKEAYPQAADGTLRNTSERTVTNMKLTSLHDFS